MAIFELILINETIIVFATATHQMDVDETPADKKTRLNRERQRRWRARLSPEARKQQRALKRANEREKLKTKRRAIIDAAQNPRNNQNLSAMEFIESNEVLQ